MTEPSQNQPAHDVTDYIRPENLEDRFISFEQLLERDPMTLKNLLERFFPNSSDRQHFLTQPRKELNNKSPQSFLDAGKTETIRLFLARREREVLPT